MKHIGGRNMRETGGDGEEEIFDGKNVSLNRQHTIVSPLPIPSYIFTSWSSDLNTNNFKFLLIIIKAFHFLKCCLRFIFLR